ncbi:MAG: polysaccharide biosynthesis protein [Acetobacteraceae bacterium]|nr:polysaccharide biosynthesis protein [Acetobacteraceae bacterium]
MPARACNGGAGRGGFYRGKKILVTGGTGSVGSEVVRQLLALGPEVVRVYSRDETKQFELEQELGPRPDVRYLIGDVRDLSRLRRAVEGIDLVFHAAALKHVPACEYNPFEAVKTNVLGVQNLIEAALDEEVERVVAISTDKVANPTNTMGATKLLAERLMAAANHCKGRRRTVFTCVRFGNVLGSRGSVVPLFHRQIARGGPVTVTHQDMTRFMMSVGQAVKLVLEAGQLGRGGEVFILKMPVLRLWDLAAVMVEALAPRWGWDSAGVEITRVGLRPGEKLHEELMTEEEASRALEMDDMFVILPMVGPRARHPGAVPAQVLRYSSQDQEPLGRRQIREMLEREGLLGTGPVIRLVPRLRGEGAGAWRREGRRWA